MKTCSKIQIYTGLNIFVCSLTDFKAKDHHKHKIISELIHLYYIFVAFIDRKIRKVIKPCSKIQIYTGLNIFVCSLTDFKAKDHHKHKIISELIHLYYIFVAFIDRKIRKVMKTCSKIQIYTGLNIFVYSLTDFKAKDHHKHKIISELIHLYFIFVAFIDRTIRKVMKTCSKIQIYTGLNIFVCILTDFKAKDHHKHKIISELIHLYYIFVAFIDRKIRKVMKTCSKIQIYTGLNIFVCSLSDFKAKDHHKHKIISELIHLYYIFVAFIDRKIRKVMKTVAHYT